MKPSRQQHVFSSPPEPPTYLVANILRRIDREERKRIFRRMAGSVGFLSLSLVAAVMSFTDLNKELARSGFLSFISLFGSDFSFATGHFHDMIFSLAESFPALAAAFTLASVGFVFWFSVQLIQEAASVRHRRGAQQLFS